MNRNWRNNKEAAKYRSTKPSLTDQSSAADTDVNVIVKKYAVTGRVPGPPTQPMQGMDFTELPNNLRDMIEVGRDLAQRMKKLPPELRNHTPEQLLALTPEQLRNILAPPAPAPAPTKEETK